MVPRFLGNVPGDRSDWLFFLDTAVHWVWFLDFLVMCQVTGVIGCFSLILLFIGYGSSILDHVGRSDWLAFAAIRRHPIFNGHLVVLLVPLGSLVAMQLFAS